MTRNMKGIHCQESPTITTVRADQAAEAQLRSPRPRKRQMGESGPWVMSASMRKV